MIWTLIGIIGILLGIVLVWISCKAEALYFDTRMDKYDTIDDVCGYIGVSMIILCGVVLAICTTAIILAHTYCGKSYVMEMKERHDALVAAQHEEIPVTVQNQLYTDIAQYNTELRKSQHWANSKWTNWFNPKGYNDLEFIEY